MDVSAKENSASLLQISSFPCCPLKEDLARPICFPETLRVLVLPKSLSPALCLQHQYCISPLCKMKLHPCLPLPSGPARHNKHTQPASRLLFVVVVAGSIHSMFIQVRIKELFFNHPDWFLRQFWSGSLQYHLGAKQQWRSSSSSRSDLVPTKTWLRVTGQDVELEKA